MMKRAIRIGLAAIALGLGGSALAQSSNVTLYGIVDTGVEYLSNANAAKNSLVRVPSLTGTFPSRWGLRGSEDLGGGLRAVVVLESGFTPDTGGLGQGGRLFGRQAYVGLSASWGTISFGRQYSMLYLSLLDSDILGPNIYATGSIDPYLPNARHDNSVSYRGMFGELDLGATYSFGRDVSSAGGPAATNCPGELGSDHNACKQWTAMVKYDTPVWGAAIAIDRLNGGPTAAFGLNSSSKTDERITANGYVKLSTVKIGGGLIRRDNEGSTTPRSDLWFLGAAVPFASTFVFDGELMWLDVKDSANDARMLALRVTDNLSKRTAVYLTAGFIDNRGASAISASAGGSVGAGLSQTGVMAGVRHFF